MKTDLTFFTNEPGSTLFGKFKKALLCKFGTDNT